MQKGNILLVPPFEQFTEQKGRLLFSTQVDRFANWLIFSNTGDSQPVRRRRSYGMRCRMDGINKNIQRVPALPGIRYWR